MVCTNSLSCCYPHLEKHSITITEKSKNCSILLIQPHSSMHLLRSIIVSRGYRIRT